MEHPEGVPRVVMHTCPEGQSDLFAHAPMAEQLPVLTQIDVTGWPPWHISSQYPSPHCPHGSGSKQYGNSVVVVVGGAAGAQSIRPVPWATGTRERLPNWSVS